jgi:hypothetical protein
VEPAKIVFGGFQTMDRYMIPDPITGKVQQQPFTRRSARGLSRIMSSILLTHRPVSSRVLRSTSRGTSAAGPLGTTRHHLGCLQARRLGLGYLARFVVGAQQA